MPLSDEEQRILREIEERLYESDPDFARHVADSPEPSTRQWAVRRLRLAAVGLCVSLALTVYLLTVHYIVAFGGFLVAFAFGLMFESALRVIGHPGLAHWAEGVRVVRHPHPTPADSEPETDDEEF